MRTVWRASWPLLAAAVALAVSIWAVAPDPTPEFLRLVPAFAQSFVAGDSLSIMLSGSAEDQAGLAGLTSNVAGNIPLVTFGRNSCLRLPDATDASSYGFDVTKPVAMFVVDPSTIAFRFTATNTTEAATYLRSQISAHRVTMVPDSSPDNDPATAIRIDSVSSSNARLCDWSKHQGVDLSQKLPWTIPMATDANGDPAVEFGLHPQGTGTFQLALSCSTVHKSGAVSPCTCHFDSDPQLPCEQGGTFEPVGVSVKGDGSPAELANSRSDGGDARYFQVGTSNAEFDSLVLVRVTPVKNGKQILMPEATLLNEVRSPSGFERFEHDSNLPRLTDELLTDDHSAGVAFGMAPNDGLFINDWSPFYAQLGASVVSLRTLFPLADPAQTVATKLLAPSPQLGQQPAPYFPSLASVVVSDDALPFYLRYLRTYRPASYDAQSQRLTGYWPALLEAVQASPIFDRARVDLAVGADGLPGLVIELDAVPGSSDDAIEGALKIAAQNLYQTETLGVAREALLSPNKHPPCPAQDGALFTDFSASLKRLANEYVSVDCFPDGTVADFSAASGSPSSEPLEPVVPPLPEGRAFYLSPPVPPEEIKQLTSWQQPTSDGASSTPTDYDAVGLAAGRYRVVAWVVGGSVLIGDRGAMLEGAPLTKAPGVLRRRRLGKPASCCCPPSWTSSQRRRHPTSTFAYDRCLARAWPTTSSRCATTHT